jgi:hypothetical protein
MYTFTINAAQFLPLTNAVCKHLQMWAGITQYNDSQQTGRSGDRIPLEARFSVPVQTGPGANPASYTMGTGSLPGVKQPGHDVDHPHLALRFNKE